MTSLTLLREAGSKGKALISAVRQERWLMTMSSRTWVAGGVRGPPSCSESSNVTTTYILGPFNGSPSKSHPIPDDLTSQDHCIADYKLSPFQFDAFCMNVCWILGAATLCQIKSLQ